MSLIPFTNISELQNTRKGLFIDLFTTNMFLMPGCILPLPPFKEDFSDREFLDMIKESIGILKSHGSHIYIDQCTNSIKILHDISIFDTGLDKNLCHVLDRYGVSTIGKLLSENRINLKSWRLIGNVRYNQIIKFVDDHGFRFFDEINTPANKNMSMFDELINTKILDIKGIVTFPLSEDDTFMLIVGHLNKISYSVVDYIKIAPLFKKYIEDKTISEEKILYREIDLAELKIKSTKIKVEASLLDLKVTTELLYDTSIKGDLIDPEYIFGKETKYGYDNGNVFLKYSVKHYIPLSNGYIFGYNGFDEM